MLTQTNNDVLEDINSSDQPKNIRATCPNCGSTEYYCLRSKDHNYSFVLGISNPEDITGKILPYLPIRVLTCGICQRITLEVETNE